MQGGSNFQDAFPALALKGFSNEELEEYFNFYRDMPCGLLEEKERQQIPLSVRTVAGAADADAG